MTIQLEEWDSYWWRNVCSKRSKVEISCGSNVRNMLVISGNDAELVDLWVTSKMWLLSSREEPFAVLPMEGPCTSLASECQVAGSGCRSRVVRPFDVDFCMS